MPAAHRFLNRKAAGIALGAVLALAAGIGFWRSGATADPPAVAPSAVPAEPVAATTGPASTGSAAAPAATPPATAVPTTARIVFLTSPAVNATVTWGKMRLGVIGPKAPLVVVRPRDSGPLDVVVRAVGYLPVYTRAHTFADSKVIVKLTPPDQVSTLLGYRVPIDGGAPIAPDGGPPITTVDPNQPTGLPLPASPAPFTP